MARVTRPEELKNRKKSNKTRIFSYPSKPMPHSMLMIFKEYDHSELYKKIESESGVLVTGRTLGITSSTNTFAKEGIVIELPMPKQLNDSTKINAGPFEKGAKTEALINNVNELIKDGKNKAAGDLLSGGIAAATGKLQSIGAEISGADSLGSFIAGKGQTAAIAAAQLARKYLPGDLQSTVNSALGTTSNPRETMGFNGVGLKTFNYTWELMPSSQADSDVIRDIVKAIKRSILPEIATEGIALPRSFLSYPSLVYISLLGVDEDYFFRYKPCMVTGFNVTYSGGDTMSIMKGGKPGMVVIEMSMTEVQIHTAEEIDEV
jgi:hypothetical protein